MNQAAEQPSPPVTDAQPPDWLGLENALKLIASMIVAVQAGAYSFAVGQLDALQIERLPTFIGAAQFFLRSVVLSRSTFFLVAVYLAYGLHLFLKDATTKVGRIAGWVIAAIIVLGCACAFGEQAVTKLVVAMASIFLLLLPATLFFALMIGKIKQTGWNAAAVTATAALSWLFLNVLGGQAALKSTTYPVIGLKLMVWTDEGGTTYLECDEEIRPVLYSRKEDDGTLHFAKPFPAADRVAICSRHFECNGPGC